MERGGEMVEDEGPRAGVFLEGTTAIWEEQPAEAASGEEEAGSGHTSVATVASELGVHPRARMRLGSRETGNRSRAGN